MSSIRRKQEGSTKLHIALSMVFLAIIAVAAVPHLNLDARAEIAKTAMLRLRIASDAVVREFETARQEMDHYKLPSDKEALKHLKMHLGNTIPENPFTQKKDIIIRRHQHFVPCDSLNVAGGWLWKLVVPEDKNQEIHTQFWLNSDTVNIDKGKGESCLQP